jgi:apolipoprotein N-acyltransferase
VNLSLSLASAILLILIFPNFNLTWLAPIALTPILVACARESRWRRRALYGWAAGFTFWFGVCYWIQFVLEVHGGMGRWGGWGTFVLFAALKGLHLGLFAAVAGFLMPRPGDSLSRGWWTLPAIAALWTGIERTHGPFGFAWLDLGNAGIGMPVPMRLAPFAGVYGLSFVFAMLGCGVALVILRRSRYELAWLVLLPLLALLPRAPRPARGGEQALVVQPNIDTEMNWTDDSVRTTERHLAVLSYARDASLILWPEVPAPFYTTDPAFRDYSAQIARVGQAYFLFGAVGRAPDASPLNSAMMLDPSGAPLGRYDKIKLVPFGEFVPAPFGWVNRITHETGDFEPGSRVVTFPIGAHRLGTFICYESAFPDLVRQFPRDGAEVIVNISNDGYFGHSAAREQHLSLVRMRAAENHRWILRATNDGITASIDPAGRVVTRVEPYRELATILRYDYRSDQTPYTRHGDWFAWSCLAAGLGACALRMKYPETRKVE